MANDSCPCRSLAGHSLVRPNPRAWVDELGLDRAEYRLVVDCNDVVRPAASGQQSKS